MLLRLVIFAFGGHCIFDMIFGTLIIFGMHLLSLLIAYIHTHTSQDYIM
jgi:hypothetical protein